MKAVAVVPGVRGSVHVRDVPEPRPSSDQALVRVLETAPGGSGVAKGDLVVSTVRRPCPEACPPCRADRSDMCVTGHYLEHGIKALHGFMAERYVESPKYMVRVPPALRPVAVLLEPPRIIAKC